MKRTSKYGSYRGRRYTVKKVVALALVLIIVASLGYLFFGDHSLTWSIFPRFSHQEEVEETTEIVPEVELTIDAPRETVEEVWSGLHLGTESATWGEQAGAQFDALAVTVKDDGGQVYFPTTFATDPGVLTVTQAVDNALALKMLLEQENHMIAWMSVLQDSSYSAYYVTASALMSERGYGYKDGNGMGWLDPGKEDTMDYVLALVSQWIDMGFAEIVLTDFHYPQTGELETVRYSVEPSEQGLEQLLVAIYDLTQEAGVSLGMELSAGALVSGSVPYEDWTDYVDRFYVAGNDLPTAQALVGAENVVVLAEQVPPSGSYLLIP